MIEQLEQFLKARSYSYEVDGKRKNYWLKGTNITDVYDIFDEPDGSKIDIAHIPNLKISHMCYESIKEGEIKKFNCIYHTQFKKWIPLKEVSY